LLAVIAAFSIGPAHAFENLIIDSTFQHPVVLSGNVQSNGWTNVASNPSVALTSGSVGGIATAATTVIVAVPNPFVGTSAANVSSPTNLPGNSGSQLVATTANAPPLSPNVSQPSLTAPTALGASNSLNIAPASPAVAVAVANPFVGAAVGSTINLPGNSGSQLVTTTFNVPPITPNVSQPSLAAPTVLAPKPPNIAPAAPAVAIAIPNPVPPMSLNISQPSSAAPTGLTVASKSANNLSGPGASGTAGANASRKTAEVGNAFLVGKIQGGSAGITNGAGGGGGAGNANGGGGEKSTGGGGSAGGASGGTFNIADVFSGGSGGKGVGGAGSTNGGATHGVPGPEAGAGLPILILLGCIAFGVMRKRWMGA
jgi:hypothetical protein